MSSLDRLQDFERRGYRIEGVRTTRRHVVVALRRHAERARVRLERSDAERLLAASRY